MLFFHYDDRFVDIHPIIKYIFWELTLDSFKSVLYFCGPTLTHRFQVGNHDRFLETKKK